MLRLQQVLQAVPALCLRFRQSVRQPPRRLHFRPGCLLRPQAQKGRRSLRCLTSFRLRRHQTLPKTFRPQPRHHWPLLSKHPHRHASDGCGGHHDDHDDVYGEARLHRLRCLRWLPRHRPRLRSRQMPRPRLTIHCSHRSRQSGLPLRADADGGGDALACLRQSSPRRWSSRRLRRHLLEALVPRDRRAEHRRQQHREALLSHLVNRNHRPRTDRQTSSCQRGYWSSPRRWLPSAQAMHASCSEHKAPHLWTS